MYGLAVFEFKNLDPSIATHTQPDENFIHAITVDISAGRPGLTIEAVVVVPVYLAPSQTGEVIIKNLKFSAGDCSISLHRPQPYYDFIFSIAVNIAGCDAGLAVQVIIFIPAHGKLGRGIGIIENCNCTLICKRRGYCC